MVAKKFAKSLVLAAYLMFMGFTSVALANASEQHDEGHGDHAQTAHHDEHGAHDEHGEEEEFNAIEMIMHHVKDAHEWHLWGEGHESMTVPLPIILWTDKGLVTFMSSEFHHNDEGGVLYEQNGMKFAKVHEKIYQLDEGAEAIAFDAEHHPTNAHAVMLDFSITKNVASLFLIFLILLLVFPKIARFYKKKGAVAPKGIVSFLEPLIVFVRDDIAKGNIGEKKYGKYVPYLLTLFFFIWFGNLLGLIPFIPGGANLTGNISVTLVLAFITLLVVNFSGNKDYWGHIFWMPGAPVPVKLLLLPIELLGTLVIKPAALMIRLFANITAGHIVVLSLVSLIFVFQTVWISPASILLVLFISVLELLVAFLQAYIFTMLTALFIGMAVQEHHH